jgi:putative ABC transport system permease protein
MDTFRQAWRTLTKRATFTLIAVLTLALGIGANSAIFSVVNAVVVRPLPFPRADRLVSVFPQNWFSKEQLVFFSRQLRSCRRLAAYNGSGTGFAVTGGGGGDRPEMLDGMEVSPSFFPTLGIHAVLGRTFLPEEEQPGRSRVALLSHELWQRRYAADPAILGRSILLGTVPHKVVGVLPPGLRFLPGEAAVWVPLTIDPQDAGDYTGTYLLLVGRLKDGVTLAQANRDVQLAAARLRERFALPAGFGGDASMVPLRDQMVGDVRPTLLVLLGAVGAILLIACANVASLVLVQTVDRHREIAVRIAIGASQQRLTRLFLAESLLLCLLGGAAGLLLADWAVRLLPALLPAGTPRANEIGLDGQVLAFTLAISLLAGLLCGLAPTLRMRRAAIAESLSGAAKGTGGGPRVGWMHDFLVVAEVAIALVLLIGAGLMLKSFWLLGNVDPGFDTGHLLTLRVEIPDRRYAEPARRELFYRQVLSRLRSLPGALSAGAIHYLPLTGSGWRGALQVEERPTAPGAEPPITHWRVITPGYFAALKLPLAAGRDFGDPDRAGAPQVAIVNEALARRFWPHESPLGKRLRSELENGKEWATIVGVARDSRYESLGIPPHPVLYRPYDQVGRNLTMSLLVRTRSAPLPMARAAEQAVWSVDREVPVFAIRDMDRVIHESVATPRVVMTLLLSFAVVALLLGMVGVYAVMSYSIRSRTHEIGIRMALGARRQSIFALMMGRGLRLTLLGSALGLAGAYLATGWMSGLLFEVGPRDPLTFVLLPLLLVASALLGCYLPARRATQVDPLEALRAG